MPDPSAIDGKIARPDEHAGVLIIGAGPAGTAAAIAAAQAGERVLLVDEHPVDPGLMGLDTPLWYGGRYTSAVQRPERLVEQLAAADPAIEQAMELGVDVRLGVTAWGLYVNGPGLRALPEPMVGLADAERAWTCGFDRLVLATGARDVAIAFPGWDQPGVMGANGLDALTRRYDAFAGRRIVVLGSGDVGLHAALSAVARGLEVAAVVEVLTEPQGAVLLAELKDAGVPVLASHVPLRAEGGLGGVERLALRDPAGAEVVIDCDTVCMAVGLSPAIELLQAAGGAITADGRRGGHVPVRAGDKTSLANVSVVGDCAGPDLGHDAWAYQAAWLQALQANADPSLVICQCEEVTRADILEVRAPKYLGPQTARLKARSLQTLLADGPANQDQIKRLTRACMGVCQARRCREQVGLMLAAASGVAPGAVPLAGFRAPVRPLPLKVIADWNETPAMSANWEIWMAIPGQWAPYAAIGTDREFAPFGEEV